MNVEGIMAAIFVLAISGCNLADSEASRGSPAFATTDSAGIKLAITQGAHALTRLGWEVDSVPDRVIGAEQDSTFLYQVSGMIGLQDGGVIVMNGGTQELRYFDGDGRLFRQVAGHGEGPGEFRMPVLVPWIATDSLLLFDMRLPRLQVFTHEGQYARTIPFEHGWPGTRRRPHGALDPSALLFERHPLVGGQVVTRNQGLHKMIHELFWYNLQTDAEAGLDTFIVDFLYREGRVLHSVPFSARAAAVVIEGGALVTDGSTWEIRDYGRGGVLRRILRIAQPPRAVTPEMIATVDPDARAAKVPIRDALPVFRSLLVDSGGWVWAEIYSWDPNCRKEWVVFDRDGQARGTVTTPPGFKPTVIAADHIWGIWLDEMRSEYVQRFRLSRRSGSATSAPGVKIQPFTSGDAATSMSRTSRLRREGA